MGGRISRREFVATLSTAAAVGAVAPSALAFQRSGAAKTRVVIVRTADRAHGVREVVKLLNVPSPKGKPVVIKPNFNTADAAPGSTHTDTLRQLMTELWDRDARSLTIGERSGPPQTKKVMEDKGVFDLARELRATVVNFEEITDADWIARNPEGSHWPQGFVVPRLVVEAPYLVSTCCLKTHGYGGVFTMSLKLAVGTTHKRLMRELHGNKEHMRRMIAEINTAFRPTFIVMDGVEAFTDGGPSQGTKVAANVFVGGTDRVAVDAVGVAILKELGANAAIMERKVFEQEQLRRAIELGLGVSSPDQIELVAPDEASRTLADRIRVRLAQ